MMRTPRTRPLILLVALALTLLVLFMAPYATALVSRDQVSLRDRIAIPGVGLVPKADERTAAKQQSETCGTIAGRWVDLAPLNDPRQEVGVAALNGLIYVAGGFHPDGSAATTVEAYDPVTDIWSFVAPLPLGVHHPGAAAVNGKFYVFGGERSPDAAPSDATFEYDPALNSWVTKARMPTPRGAMGTGVVDGKIYAAGGEPFGENDFAVYDPVVDTWTALPPMPTPRNHLAGGGEGSTFYAVGGRSGAIGGITSVVEAFDTNTSSWRQRTVMPTPRGGIGGTVAGDCLYIFGGENNPTSPVGIFDQTEIYDPSTDSWRSLTPMAVARHGIGAAALGNRIYIPGGATVEGFGVTGAHQAFDVATP
jgi:hypothetical protein